MATTLHALRHLPVLDANGDDVGRVVDLSLDPETWRVKALVVRVHRRLAGRLGVGLLGSRLLVLKIIHVHEVGDAVVLRDGLDDLAGVAPVAREEAEHLPH